MRQMAPRLKLSDLTIYNKGLSDINNKRLLINTLNAHSFCLSQNDEIFAEALVQSDIILPDGISIVWAKRFLTGEILRKIAGYDLFHYEMTRLNHSKGTCFFLGSDNHTLQLIFNRAKKEFPKVKISFYSPPFKSEFTNEENIEMITSINRCHPDVLFIGMTAPKQEKWAYNFYKLLKVGHVCCIGAVFDFYAKTVTRAPNWIIRLGLEWLFRWIKEPRRMWPRYFTGIPRFAWLVLKEKIKM